MRNWVMFSSTEENEINKEHLDKTIWGGVSIQDCYNNGLLTDEEKGILERLFPDGFFHCWGTHDGNTKVQFDKIEVDDFVLASSGEIADIKGRVVYVMNRANPDLGYELWTSREWKWIFFISDIQRVTISLANVQSLIGYNNYTVQGLNVKVHSNVEHVIEYVEGRKTWEEVSRYIVNANQTRNIKLSTVRTVYKRNGEQMTATWRDIIKLIRRSLSSNNIQKTAKNVYDYLEGDIDGINVNKMVFYGKGAEIDFDTFNRLYGKYIREM